MGKISLKEDGDEKKCAGILHAVRCRPRGGKIARRKVWERDWRVKANVTSASSGGTQGKEFWAQEALGPGWGETEESLITYDGQVK